MERRKLVASLIARDEAAWRQFVRDYAHVIYAVATEIGFSQADREDLLQGTCLTVLQSIHTLREPSKLGSWVYSIAYRSAIDRLRKRREYALPKSSTETSGSPVLSLPATAAEQLQRIEEVAQLKDGMAQLDARCRSLLTSLYLSDHRPSYRSLSHSLKMPIGSIGPTRARCLKKLKELLTEISNPSRSPSARRGLSRPNGRT